ncbi:uncharacterized protein LOC113229944 [Hyposmocoma kahamanoa]|uniref:uncharacterized protein LOC113229944 n=1 Tax=Hyposmocoma kahamanoa TaxID=1477025 RepID=UPI000E6D5BFE|nr:uncharacterized protein LOC113229944 [Hyposmocoma kahamanoa]
MAFVDYEKAFDSIKHWAVFHALHRCHIDSRYVDVPRELYRSATLQVRVHDLTNPVPIRRGLEDVVKTLKWDNRGININGVTPFVSPKIRGRSRAICKFRRSPKDAGTTL